VTQLQRELQRARLDLRHLRRSLREAEARYDRLLAAEKEDRAKAQVAEANLRAVLSSSPLPIVVLDLQGNVETWNQAARETLGWTEKELVGRPLPIIPARHQDDANQVFYRLLGGERVLGIEVERQRKDGTRIFLNISAAPLLDPEGRVERIVEVYADVTARKRADELLEFMALHDPLTGLPNRLLLKRRIDTAAAGESGWSSPFLVMVMDLDQFKEINDRLGHQFGDEVLQAVAARIRQVLRPGDTLSRLGGDEFAILVAQASLADAPAIAAKIMTAFNEPFHVEDEQIALTTSIGAASSRVHGGDAKRLLHCADLAMYAAKRDRCGFRSFVEEAA